MRPIKKLLWVSDGHACSTESPEEFERFSWLGHFIAKEKPDTIIYGGDMWDNPSLNTHKGSTLLPGAGKESPGAAAKHDILKDWNAGRDAMMKILGVFKADNERHRKAGHKERIYEPESYFLEGNHEEFWTRARIKHPSIGSLVSNQAAIEFLNGVGIQWVPAREKLLLGGVAFQHQHPDGRGQPIVLNSLLSELLMSNVSGHNHGYGEREKIRADGKVQRAIVAGCWKSPERLGTKDRPGLLLMEDVHHGEFHHRFIPQHIVARDYRAITGGLAAA